MTELGEKLTINNVTIKISQKVPISYCEENCLLVNDGNISIAKVSDRKLVHSWTVTHPHKLTCPVVFDKKDGSIYCVMDHKCLLKWSPEVIELKLKAAKIAEFQEPIFSVIPVLEQSPIILFNSGKVIKCDDLGSNIPPKGQGLISKGEAIIWADAIIKESNIQLLYIGLAKKNKLYTLYNLTLGEDVVFESRVQILVNGNTTLVDFCLNKKANCLYTAWSSGTVLSHHTVESQEPVTVLPKLESNNVEPILSVASLDEYHIVVLKANSLFKVAFLEIWDVRFIALKAKKRLNAQSEKMIVISPQLTVLGSSIYLSNDEELFEIPYHVEKSSLAAAVGKLNPGAPLVQEFNWSKGKLTKKIEAEALVEKMDTSDIEIIPVDPTEQMAKRLVDEGPDFLNYIPESDLIRLLRLGLRYKFKEAGTFSLDIDPDVILSAIFSTTFTDAFLVQFMKKLSLEESMVTLKTLIKFLRFHAHTENTSQTYPSDLQLLNWIFIVYQAHMEALLLSKDIKCIRLLKKLYGCITEKIAEYEDYDTMQNLFLFLQKDTNLLPEKYISGKYCIESLET